MSEDTLVWDARATASFIACTEAIGSLRRLQTQAAGAQTLTASVHLQSKYARVSMCVVMEGHRVDLVGHSIPEQIVVPLSACLLYALSVPHGQTLSSPLTPSFVHVFCASSSAAMLAVVPTSMYCR